MADQQTCEVEVDGAWSAVSLLDARSIYRMVPKRCPACHGQVIIAGNFTSGGSYKLQHRRSHPGCPLTPAAFTGTPSRHPQAIG
ncbi:hypothetical protein [Methylobacterium sp. J-077]|uniref:hypothetical protein n=1 Tax=Methylobacterium sp. J-077 TaxID=2836656 RepID=UPI001FB872B6|nr:hypothetical protein [Methylobacterium sp. J-077]MCJ2126782.1 hypothetical protein [Methylobacterium sp. J-077]